MFRWLLLATLLAASLAEEAAVEKEASEKAAVPEDLNAEESRDHDHDHERHYNDYGEDLPGTGVLREVIPSHEPLPHKRIKEQDRIVYDRYSPTYYQPNWILDYRYLKTGGRDYVRGEGGQILILPKGIKAPPDEKKQFGNFDELLEFLRLQELAEREALHLKRSGHRARDRDDRDDHEDRRERWLNEHKELVGWRREHDRENRRQGDRERDHHERDRNDREWHGDWYRLKHRELNGWEKEAIAKWRH